MRLIPTPAIVLIALSALAACGTKTPLTLPPQPQPAARTTAPPAAAEEKPGTRTAPATDNSTKPATEPRQ